MMTDQLTTVQIRRVLTIGGGSLPPFVSHLSPSVAFYSLDLRQSTLLDTAQHICADPLDMPLVDNTFAVVYAGYLISQTSQERAYRIAEEAYRILQPDGLFIFNAKQCIFFESVGFRDVQCIQYGTRSMIIARK